MAKLLFFVFSALGHYVWFQWGLARFPAMRERKRFYAALTVLLVLLRFIVGRLPLPDAWITQLVAACTVEAMAVAITLIPLVFLMGVTRSVSRILSRDSEKNATPRTVVQKLADEVSGATPEITREPSVIITRRELVERAGGLAILGGSSLALGWGMVRGRHAYEIMEVPVKIVGLPRALDGYTIAQISDIHVGSFVGAREFGEGFALLARIKPDLIVVTGDMVDHDDAYVGEMVRAISALQSRDGIAACLGNHDYYTGATNVRSTLEKAGVRVLVNDAIQIRPQDGGGFNLLGVDDYFGQRKHREGGPRLDIASRKVHDGPRILLAHQPQFFDEITGDIALQLSGHTHGGQINPGIRPADLFMKYVAGRYVKGNSTLWVNRGFGTAGPPSRVGAPPEVTKIILVAA